MLSTPLFYTIKMRLLCGIFFLAFFPGLIRSWQCVANPDAGKNLTSVRPVVVFVHLHKGGGSSVKFFLEHFAQASGITWLRTGLHDPANPFNDQHVLQLNQLDVVNGAWGYCDLITRPCLYLTNLRDPVDTAVSFYRYCCVKGHDDCRFIWEPSWIRCKLSVEQWFDFLCAKWHGLCLNGQMSGLATRMTRVVQESSKTAACTSVTEVPVDTAAFSNVFSPCTRYIITENLADGLERVEGLLLDLFFKGEKIPSLSLKRDIRLNQNPKQSSEGRAELREKLWLREHMWGDTKLHQLATAMYEASWERQLEFC